MSDAADGHDMRTTNLHDVGAALASASVHELWRTLDEVDWLISTLETEDRAQRAILRSFAEVISAEARLHDRDLDHALRTLLDHPADPS